MRQVVTGTWRCLDLQRFFVSSAVTLFQSVVHRLSVRLFQVLLTEVVASRLSIIDSLYTTRSFSFLSYSSIIVSTDKPHGRNFGCRSLSVSLYVIHGTTCTRVSDPLANTPRLSRPSFLRIFLFLSSTGLFTTTRH